MSEPIKKFYPDGICPDCAQPIPEEAVEGDKCANCGCEFSEADADSLSLEDGFFDDDLYLEELFEGDDY